MSEIHTEPPGIFLVGHPNVGKSVLFNALTGAYSTVSNYPGTSVEVSSGHCVIRDQKFRVLDTPGMYSLMPITEEERVARRILLTEAAHVVIHVIDARNIDRMLPMTLQLIEAGLPLILVVNILDEAERLGLKLDLKRLQQQLGVPVIGAVMKRKVGLDEIFKAIVDYRVCPHKTFEYQEDLERDLATIVPLLQGDYLLSKRALAMLLIQGDEEIRDLIGQQEVESYADQVTDVVRDVVYRRRVDLHLQIGMERRRIGRQMLEGVIAQTPQTGESFAQKLSRWMVHPVTGVPLLLLVIYFGLFQFVGVFGAGILVDFLEGFLFEEYINPPVIEFAQRYLTAEWLFELVAGEYGIWTLGIRYAVALVLPIVGSFFLVFSILEDSGYLPRLALLIDRLFKTIGLSGRAVIPMVLGFGCDTMATLVTRTLETRRERIISTLLLAMVVPCSAQLGVILGLLSAEPLALAVWMLVLLLIFVLVGVLADRLLPGERPVFYMEIPPLRLPQPANVALKTLTRMKGYFLEILPLFIIASVVLWAGKMAGVLDLVIATLAPVVRAIGLPLEATTAFVFGFFRRDFGAAGLYDLQMSGLLTIAQLTVAAVTLTLFVPCVAQFLVMLKERGVKVASVIFVFVTMVAFLSGWLLNRFLQITGLLG